MRLRAKILRLGAITCSATTTQKEVGATTRAAWASLLPHASGPGLKTAPNRAGHMHSLHASPGSTHPHCMQGRPPHLVDLGGAAPPHTLQLGVHNVPHAHAMLVLYHTSPRPGGSSGCSCGSRRGRPRSGSRGPSGRCCRWLHRRCHAACVAGCLGRRRPHRHSLQRGTSFQRTSWCCRRASSRSSRGGWWHGRGSMRQRRRRRWGHRQNPRRYPARPLAATVVERLLSKGRVPRPRRGRRRWAQGGLLRPGEGARGLCVLLGSGVPRGCCCGCGCCCTVGSGHGHRVVVVRGVALLPGLRLLLLHHTDAVAQEHNLQASGSGRCRGATSQEGRFGGSAPTPPLLVPFWGASLLAIHPTACPPTLCGARLCLPRCTLCASRLITTGAVSSSTSASSRPLTAPRTPPPSLLLSSASTSWRCCRSCGAPAGLPATAGWA